MTVLIVVLHAEYSGCSSKHELLLKSVKCFRRCHRFEICHFPLLEICHFPLLSLFTYTAAYDLHICRPRWSIYI